MCIVRGCKTNKAKKSNKCDLHRTRAARKANPMRYYYLNLKHNAKRRNKPFDLIYEQFQQFAHETSYTDAWGRKLSRMTVDRIDSLKGYTLDNIQPLTRKENGFKGATIDKHYHNGATLVELPF